MATGLNSAIADDILDAFTNTAAWTSPTAFYVKLHIGDPGSAGTSNTAAESTRKSVTFGASSGGAISNSVAVTWTSVAATETYSHVSFWDHVTAGVFLGSDDLASTKAVTAGDNAEFAIGDLDITLTPIAA